jgi:hypothetical protein
VLRNEGKGNAMRRVLENELDILWSRDRQSGRGPHPKATAAVRIRMFHTEFRNDPTKVRISHQQKMTKEKIRIGYHGKAFHGNFSGREYCHHGAACFCRGRGGSAENSEKANAEKVRSSHLDVSGPLKKKEFEI